VLFPRNRHEGVFEAKTEEYVDDGDMASLRRDGATRREIR
jgi:hypothetical protein